MITPTRETSRIAQKLKEIITTRGTELGATPSGRDWCLKALHPSDPLTEVRGIPDESAVPSLFMNYQSVYTISPSVGATGTWTLDGQLIPNPLSFGAALYTDSVSAKAVEFVNTQVGGASHPERLNNFLADFARWRLAYASVTIYQDGPDLANQGTVVVCQKPVEPTRFNLYDGQNGQFVAQGLHHAFHLEASDLPDYTRSQSMPNAYFGKSKEGVYIPLKLTKTHQQWHSHRDLLYQSTASSVVAYTTSTTGGRLNIPTSASDDVNGQYPFLSINDLHQRSSTYTNIYGSLTSDFCNENWADFSFRNMAVTTSLSMFFRFGFEVQVPPTSSMAPHLKLSPPSDPAAVSAYFAISRELKDAYPADFNDLGKIWDVISTVGKTIAPALNFVPGVGPLLAGGARAALSMGDRIRDATRRVATPTQGSIASAADLEVVRSAKPTRPMTAPSGLSVQRIKKAKKRMARNLRTRA